MPKSARRRGRTASDGLRIRGMGISMISGIGRGRSEARPSLGTRLARALKNLDTSRMSASVKMAGSLNFPKLTVEFRRSVFTAHVGKLWQSVLVHDRSHFSRFFSRKKLEEGSSSSVQKWRKARPLPWQEGLSSCF